MRIRTFLAESSLLAALALGVGTLTACSHTDQPAQVGGTGATRSPLTVQGEGPSRAVTEALGEVPLRPEQRQIAESLAKEAQTRHLAAREAGKKMAIAIAEQVEAGQIDRAKLAPIFAEVKVAFEKTRTDDLAALQKLHDTLDKDQRTAFIQSLGQKAKEHHGMFGQEHAPNMNGHAMFKDLNLSDDQKTKIHEILKEEFHGGHGEWKGHHAAKGGEGGPPNEGHARGDGPPHGDGPRHGGMHAAWKDFSDDGFKVADAAARGPFGKGDPAAAAKPDRMLDMAEKILPILTPEQRKIAATKLRERANGPAAR